MHPVKYIEKAKPKKKSIFGKKKKWGLFKKTLEKNKILEDKDTKDSKLGGIFGMF